MEEQKRKRKPHSMYGRWVLRENVRRMLFTSVCFCVLFVLCAVLLKINNDRIVNARIVWVLLVLEEVYAVVFGWRAYRWLYGGKRWNIQLEVSCFWLIFETVLIVGALAAGDTFYKLVVYWIMTAVLAIGPLYNSREFLASLAVQIAALVVLIVCQRLGIQTIIYLAANQLLCGVISRQGYYNFLRRAEDAEAIDTAKILSETDPMTKLFNRRGLERRIERMWNICVRSNKKVAVIMIDIDNFKKYNDCFGHLEGDNCIRKVAGEIHNMTKKKSELAARVGGEEFVICIPDVDKAQALNWAMMLKENVEKLCIQQADNNFLPIVSISVGVAWGYARKSGSFFQMQEQADEALYRAKESGRACVYMEENCYAKTRAMGKIHTYYEDAFRSLG